MIPLIKGTIHSNTTYQPLNANYTVDPVSGDHPSIYETPERHQNLNAQILNYFQWVNYPFNSLFANEK